MAVQYLYYISLVQYTIPEHPDEEAFPGHDAIAYRFLDYAVVVAFLADRRFSIDHAFSIFIHSEQRVDNPLKKM